jgi:hypothetical protein
MTIRYSPSKWDQQPPAEWESLNASLPAPTAVFRSTGNQQLARGVGIASSSYINCSRTNTAAGTAVKVAGASGDGIQHTFVESIARKDWAIAAVVRIDSIAANGTIFGLNGLLQVRVTTGGQIEMLNEGNFSMATSSFAGYGAGQVRCFVVRGVTGGPVTCYEGGLLRASYAPELDIGVVDKFITFGRRGGASEALNGAIVDAAFWGREIPSAGQCAEVSGDFYGRLFALDLPRVVSNVAAATLFRRTLSNRVGSRNV